MPDYPIVFSSYHQTSNGVSGSTGTTVTGGGTNHVKGSYAQIVASTPHSAQMWEVTVSDLSGAAVDGLMDIAIGGAGSERVIVDNLPISVGGTSLVGCNKFVFATPIPAGSRLAARLQTSNVTQTAMVSIRLIQADARSTSGFCGRVTTMGATTASTAGTTIDPGGTLNTKGSWVQISSSTASHFRRLHLGILNKQQSTRPKTAILIDIGVGASGSERIVVPDIYINNPINGVLPSISPIPISIPAGTRLAVRAAANNGASGSRTFDAILYGEN